VAPEHAVPRRRRDRSGLTSTGLLLARTASLDRVRQVSEEEAAAMFEPPSWDERYSSEEQIWAEGGSTSAFSVLLPGTDPMGVCVEPPRYIAGLRPFEHWVYRTQPEGAPSGPGDLDLTIYGLRKYCRMALKGSPTVLLLLFIDGEHVLQRDPLGQELQAPRRRSSPNARDARSWAMSMRSGAG
jgi:hypothetical protein